VLPSTVNRWTGYRQNLVRYQNVSRYVILLFSFPASLLPGTGKRRARRIVHGSELKVGHATNCNKYLVRTRSTSAVWGITCRIYIGTRFSSFERLYIPPPAHEIVYIPRESRAQRATSCYFIAGDSADSHLYFPPSLLSVSWCPPLRRKTGIGIARGAEAITREGEGGSAPSILVQAPGNKDLARVQEKQYSPLYLFNLLPLCARIIWRRTYRRVLPGAVDFSFH